jgi:predicted regulator of Ras-like GTPase activity (Roadblock/LC7/MglB family)
VKGVFAATLRDVVSKLEGAQGAAVLNLDGVVIEAVDAAGQSVNPDEALGDYASVFTQLFGVTDAVELGEIQQLTVEGTDRLTLVRPLDAQYVVALQVSPDTIPGRAHFYLRVAAPDLAREL